MTIDKLLFCNMYNILTLAAPDRWRYCTTRDLHFGKLLYIILQLVVE